ncbi:UPF0272 protein [Ktedonobacter sp. SOSP1-85]|uniref:LarC family nickel insertion protein n=1 Tax=Ktedonobacter sp. SOSP1-85 TaxID=2778367 RepID=UPI001916BA8B|nr:LarC family nickel insertion protein [Ktedonobacter sp. SOSP1-85]GHO77371.1 UPF0272 protein [Ktedonobacter sp. SOSP1-85]
MLQNQVVYLDCYDGITAPLLLGALFEMGLDLNVLKKAMDALPLPDHTITSQKQYTPVRGSSATLTLTTPETLSPWKLAETPVLLPPGMLKEPVRQHVLSMVQRIAEATGRVRNISVKDVQLPDMTPLLWFIAVTLGLDMLNLHTLYASPLPMPSGTQQGPQGHKPLLLPETLELLAGTGATWRPTTIGRELITLEGAALLAELASFEPVNFSMTQVAYGCVPGNNASDGGQSLRLCLGNLSPSSRRAPQPAPSLVQTTQGQAEAETDWVTVLETNIDNMSGELLGGLLDHLLELGALDVSYTPMQMKKNRPATLIRVIAPPELGEQLAMSLLRETTTLGVRFQHMQRLKARREPRTIQTSFGPMLVKVKYLGEQLISASPEYEECARVARERNIPLADVYEVARSAVQTLIIGSRKKV